MVFAFTILFQVSQFRYVKSITFFTQQDNSIEPFNEVMTFPSIHDTSLTRITTKRQKVDMQVIQTICAASLEPRKEENLLEVNGYITRNVPGEIEVRCHITPFESPAQQKWVPLYFLKRNNEFTAMCSSILQAKNIAVHHRSDITGNQETMTCRINMLS